MVFVSNTKYLEGEIHTNNVIIISAYLMNFCNNIFLAELGIFGTILFFVRTGRV